MAEAALCPSVWGRELRVGSLVPAPLPGLQRAVLRQKRTTVHLQARVSCDGDSSGKGALNAAAGRVRSEASTRAALAPQHQHQQRALVKTAAASLALGGASLPPKAPPTSPSTTWLLQFHPYSELSSAAVAALTRKLVVRTVNKGEPITVAGQQADAMWVVVQGSVTVEGDASDTISSVCVFYGNGNEVARPGSVIEAGCTLNLQESLLKQASHVTTRATSNKVVLWKASLLQVQAVARAYPEIGLQLSRLISERLERVTGTIKSEQARMVALQPYLVPAPRRGIIGSSKYAMRLRKQVVDASRDKNRGPVLVYGEPGLEKDNVAALIHVGSKDYQLPVVKIDCDRYSASDGLALEIELFGAGAKKGLLYWLRDGTLLLNNVHKVPPKALSRILDLLQDSSRRGKDAARAAAASPSRTPASADTPANAGPDTATSATTTSSSPTSSSPEAALASRQWAELRGPRILMTAELAVPAIEASGLVKAIKVPPLRLRPADIRSLVNYFLMKAAKREGGAGVQPAVLTPEALRRLENYAFPNNATELESAVERALRQQQLSKSAEAVAAAPAATKELTSDVFWFAAQDTNRYRLDLMKTFPLLRTIVRSEFWPRTFNYKIVEPIFIAVVILLFVGPQDRAHNFALNLFWDWWWPGIFIVYPFLGRIWCSFCPFMITGELWQNFVVASGGKLRKWPRESIQQWGPWFLYALFFAILVWEECWNLEDTAYLSSWLLLIITAGAVVCSTFFERRLWCRYLCPIGGMNGLFSMMSITELRARQGVCSGSCSTYHCYKGGPEEPPEGLETNGCPLYSHPAQLESNRHCVLCMDCVKACPHRSVQINLRPPGADIWQGHKGDVSELSLLFMLLGAVFLHVLPELCGQFGIDSVPLTSDLATHIAVSCLVLAAPLGLLWGADKVVDVAVKRQQQASGSGPSLVQFMEPGWIDVAYGWVPMVWAATLAYYCDNLMGEAGQLLPVAAATFGLDGSWMPRIVAQPPVISFVQVAVLVIGAGISGITTWHLGKRLSPRVVTQWALLAGATLELWYLIVKVSWNQPLFGL